MKYPCELIHDCPPVLRTGSGATRCYGFRGGCPDGVRAKGAMKLGQYLG